jgi:hypothetical protein
MAEKIESDFKAYYYAYGMAKGAKKPFFPPKFR